MKKSHILIALAILIAFTAASCKNIKRQEPTQEKIQEQKKLLADSALAIIDASASKYWEATDKTLDFRNIQLTKEQKMVKPTYLLDPSIANTLVTKNQKVNALGMYIADYSIRILYDMPTAEVKEVMTKLATDLNFPVSPEKLFKENIVPSEMIREEYEGWKKSGELALFWKLQNAIFSAEFDYIIANDVDLFFNNVNEEQFEAWLEKWHAMYRAMAVLAENDDDLAAIYKEYSNQWETWKDDYKSISYAKNYYRNNKVSIINRRNNLLK